MRTLIGIIIIIIIAIGYSSPIFAGNSCQSLLPDMRSQKVWHKANKVFVKYLNAELQESIDLHWKEHEQNDLRSQLLKNLGFQFKNKQVFAPGLKTLSTNFNTSVINSMQDWNRANPNNLKSLENLIANIGFVFKNKQDQWITLSYGEYVPKGYTLFNDLTPGAQLYRSLNKGLFPLSFGQEGAALHDIRGHLTSYAEHINYGFFYKKLANMIVESNLQGSLLIKNPSLFWRVAYFNESLVLVSKKKLKKLIHLFTIPENTKASYGQLGYSYLQIHSELKKMDLPELLSTSQNLITAVPQLIIEMGGAARDHYYINSDLSYLYHIPKLLTDNLTTSMNEVENSPESLNLNNYSALLYSLAALQAALLQLSEISEESWFEQISSPNNPNSSIHHFFNKESGIFQFDKIALRNYNELGVYHSDLF